MHKSIERAYARGKQVLSRQVNKDEWTKLDEAESTEPIHQHNEKKTEESIETYTEKDTEKYTAGDNITEKGCIGIGQQLGINWRLSKAYVQSKITQEDPICRPLGLQSIFSDASQSRRHNSQSELKPGEIDIVVIPDLTSYYESSFIHANGTDLVRDLLPKNFPLANIHSFAYHPKAFFEEEDFMMLANRLLDSVTRLHGGMVRNLLLTTAETERSSLPNVRLFSYATV